MTEYVTITETKKCNNTKEVNKRFDRSKRCLGLLIKRSWSFSFSGLRSDISVNFLLD